MDDDTDDRDIVFPLQPWLVPPLRELPGLLVAEQPQAVEERLFPDPTDDRRANADWQRMVVPELRALLVSARELVEQDLQSLAPTDATRRHWQLVIPMAHLRAWIAALNAARLTLGVRYQIEDEDLERESESIEDERDEAIWRVHFYGSMQAALIDEITY